MNIYDIFDVYMDKLFEDRKKSVLSFLSRFSEEEEQVGNDNFNEAFEVCNGIDLTEFAKIPYGGSGSYILTGEDRHI